MDILEFIISNWWIFLIIFAIVFTIWAMRNLLLIKVNPTFEFTNLEYEKTIDLDTFRSYQKELTDLGFKHEGDFNLHCLAGGMFEQMAFKETLSIFTNSNRRIIAYISANSYSGQKECLEFSTTFQDGRQVNTSNSKKKGTVEQPLPTVFKKHYPRCSTADLLDFHKKNLQEYGGFSKPEPIPGNIMEKKIVELRKQYEYNREIGILIKNKSRENYKIALPALLKSAGRGFRDLLAKIIPDTDKGKIYRTGFFDTGARELHKQKKIIKFIFGLYFIFPISAAVYKFFFMHPFAMGYFILLWYAAFMAFGYGVFIELPPSKKVIFMELVYFAITGIATYTILWTLEFTGFSIFFIFLLIAMIITFSGIEKKKLREKTAITIISIILILMVFLLPSAFRIIVFIHSFRHLDGEKVREICIYGYNNEWDNPFHFSGAEPEVEIRDKEGLEEFCSSLQDISPYRPECGPIKGQYLVRIEMQDGSNILFTLGRKNSGDYEVATIGFVTKKCLETGKFYGPSCNRGCQSKSLLEFLLKVRLKKWHPDLNSRLNSTW